MDQNEWNLYGTVHTLYDCISSQSALNRWPVVHGGMAKTNGHQIL
jgi:hypothetical protein